MNLYKRGDGVILTFPYAHRTDCVVCISSSQNAPDPSSITLALTDATAGVLRKQSYLRPAYLFTTSENRVSRKVGVMKTEQVQAALQTLTALFQA